MKSTDMTKAQVELAIKIRDFVQAQNRAVTTGSYNYEFACKLLADGEAAGLPEAGMFDLRLQIEQHRHGVTSEFYPGLSV